MIDGIDVRLGSPGMFRSRTSTAGFRPEVRRRAVSASPASATTSMSPSASTIRRRPSRTISWSSARMIVIVSASLGPFGSAVIRFPSGTVVAFWDRAEEAARQAATSFLWLLISSDIASSASLVRWA